MKKRPKRTMSNVKKKRTGSVKKAKHDPFIKKAMESPIVAKELFVEYLPAEFKDFINLDTLKIEKESFIEDDLKTKFSDIIYSATTNDAKQQDALIYCLLEHQSSPDYWIALRLWKYCLLLLERHAKDKNKLPVILPLVLYNGQQKYSAPLNLWDLFTYPDLAKGAMTNNYNLIDLNAMSDEDINYEKHLSFLLYTMKHIHDRDLLNMLKEAMNKCTKALIIDKGHDYVHTKLIFWYTNSKIPEKNKQLLEQIIIDNLPKQDTEVIMRSIADSYIDQGINKGIAIGKNEGIAIGKNEGIAIGKNEGIAIGKNEGIAIGKNEGINIGITNTALNMLKHNFDINTISSVTGLSQKEITQLKNKT